MENNKKDSIDNRTFNDSKSNRQKAIELLEGIKKRTKKKQKIYITVDKNTIIERII